MSACATSFRAADERTVVLIHEMGGSLESWDEVAPVLAANRRVLRYDTRGAGLSEKVRGALCIDTMVDDLGALLDALGIVGKVALAGIAVGGAIALHAAVRMSNASRRGGGQPCDRHRAGPACGCAGPCRAHRARGHARCRRGHDGQRLPRRSCGAMRRALPPSAPAGSATTRRAMPPSTACWRRWTCRTSCPHRLPSAGAGRPPRPCPPAGDGRAGGPRHSWGALPGAGDGPLHGRRDAGVAGRHHRRVPRRG